MKRKDSDGKKFFTKFGRYPNSEERELIGCLKDTYSIKRSTNLSTQKVTRFNVLLNQLVSGIPFEKIKEIHENLDKMGFKHGVSEEKLVFLYGEEEGKKHWEKIRKSYASSEEKFIARYGEEEGKKRWVDYCNQRGVCLKAYIARYGEEEGKKRHKEFWERTNFGTTKKKFDKRHGTNSDEEWEKWKRQQGFNNTLAGRIEKHGEEKGKTIYYESNQRKSVSQSKDNFVKTLKENGFSDNEILEKISDRWNRTSKESFVRKYGEEGEARYAEYLRSCKVKNPLSKHYLEYDGMSPEAVHQNIQEAQNARQIGASQTRVSKESIKFLNDLVMFLDERIVVKSEHRIKLSRDEYGVSNRRNLFYDFYLPNFNMIIEYHGARYHNTNIDYNNINYNFQLSDFDLTFEMDLFKPWIAKTRGFDVVIIRSWCYKEDFKYLLERIRAHGS